MHSSYTRTVHSGQADTLSELRGSLKEAIEMMIEYTLEDGKEADVRKLYKIMGRDLKKKGISTVSGKITVG